MNAVIGAHVNVMLNVTTISSSAVGKKSKHFSFSNITIVLLSAGGRDFEVIDREVPLPIYSVCHQLHIIDDAEPEFEEEFYICVQHNPLVEILTECAEVHIIDDDSKCVNPIISDQFTVFLFVLQHQSWHGVSRGMLHQRARDWSRCVRS